MNAFGVTRETLRGTNYLFNSSLLLQADFSLLAHPHSDSPNSTTGSWSTANVDSDLAVIARAGFNNVRIWLPFFGWMIDKPQFRAHLREFVGLCHEHRLTITWVLWNAIGNGIGWTTADLAQFATGAPDDPYDDALYAKLGELTAAFQQTHREWVPDDRPGMSCGYPSPGNRAMQRSGHPSEWGDAGLAARAAGFLTDVLEVIDTETGRSTMFMIDLANEFDGVGIPLEHTLAFAAWNLERIRAVLPAAPVTIGWAQHGVDRYREYVDTLDDLGLYLDHHSFHIYVHDLGEYQTRVLPLIEWARQRSVDLLVSEFYRTDTAEWGHLEVALEFFAQHRVPWILWGFIASNLYGDPARPGPQGNPRLDGIVEAIAPEFGRTLDYRPLNDADHAAVLRANGA